MKTKKEFIQLVAANRILANENVVDAFGHVSIRHPDDPDRYVMSRSRAPELVELEDLMEYDVGDFKTAVQLSSVVENYVWPDFKVGVEGSWVVFRRFKESTTHERKTINQG